jgi:hypothetical protein
MALYLGEGVVTAAAINTVRCGPLCALAQAPGFFLRDLASQAALGKAALEHPVVNAGAMMGLNAALTAAVDGLGALGNKLLHHPGLPLPAAARQLDLRSGAVRTISISTAAIIAASAAQPLLHGRAYDLPVPGTDGVRLQLPEALQILQPPLGHDLDTGELVYGSQGASWANLGYQALVPGAAVGTGMGLKAYADTLAGAVKAAAVETPTAAMRRVALGRGLKTFVAGLVLVGGQRLVSDLPTTGAPPGDAVGAALNRAAWEIAEFERV